MAGIAQEGAALWYRRMPLSRNRTPSHQDLSELHEGAFCADGVFDEKFATDTWKKRGVISALAIQMPERFGRELLSLLDISRYDQNFAMTSPMNWMI